MKRLAAGKLVHYWLTTGVRCAIMAFIGLIAVSGCNRLSDREAFEEFSGYKLPEDVKNFRWETSNYDEFGDHDGKIEFEASRLTLVRISEQKFRGSAQWNQQGADSFSMTYSATGEMIKGSINLKERVCRIEYSTY